MIKMLHEFKEVGEKVIAHQPGYIRKAEIYKFYKNGNFVIEKGGQQYTKYGHPTDSRWNSTTIRPYSDELWNDLQKPFRIRAACRAIEETIRKVDDPDFLEKILALISDKVGATKK